MICQIRRMAHEQTSHLGRTKAPARRNRRGQIGDPTNHFLDFDIKERSPRIGKLINNSLTIKNTINWFFRRLNYVLLEAILRQKSGNSRINMHQFSQKRAKRPRWSSSCASYLPYLRKVNLGVVRESPLAPSNAPMDFTHHFRK